VTLDQEREHLKRLSCQRHIVAANMETSRDQIRPRRPGAGYAREGGRRQVPRRGGTRQDEALLGIELGIARLPLRDEFDDPSKKQVSNLG
jgi:hypothetical protein